MEKFPVLFPHCMFSLCKKNSSHIYKIILLNIVDILATFFMKPFKFYVGLRKSFDDFKIFVKWKLAESLEENGLKGRGFVQ
jgi:hypothetical protein